MAATVGKFPDSTAPSERTVLYFLLTILGIGTGIGLSYLVRSLIVYSFPTMTILLTGEWMLRASLIALITSLLGACYPALKATRQDAIQALAYE